MREPETPQRRRRWPIIVGALVALLFIMAFFFFKDEALGEHGDLAVAERPEIENGEASFAAWLVAARKVDKGPFEEAVRSSGGLFFEKLAGTKPWDAAPIEHIVTANREAFELAFDADSLGPFALPAVHSVHASFPYFSQLQNLSKMLRVYSAERFVAADFETAEKAALANLRLGDSLVDQPNTLLAFLVGIACQAIGYATVERLIADGTPDEVLLNLDALLRAELDPCAALERALRIEFALSSDAVKQIGKFGSGALGGGLKGGEPPTFLLKQNRTINDAAKIYRVLIANCQRPPTTRVEPPVAKSPKGLDFLSSNAYGKWLNVHLNGLANLQSNADHALAYRRSLRAKIALLRHHRAEGALPAALADLVPDYLDAVPTDPHDGAPLRYDAARGAVWVVGRDLTDAGGATATHGNGFSGKQPDPTLFVFPHAP